MKLLSILLLIAIIIHQSIRPVLDSSLLVELTGLVLFYFVGGRMFREYLRSTERRKYLRGVEKRHLSKSGKDWRDSRSSVEVQVEKTDYFDRL